MAVQTTVVPGIRERRRWFVIGAAAIAAVVIGSALALTIRSSGVTSGSGSAPVASALKGSRGVPSVMSLTPARLAAGALDVGYSQPEVQHGPTMASVLASMSPSTRRYTRAVMALTFAQLAVGAAGSP